MSIGAWLRKEAVMPITEAKWWGDVVTGKKPFTLASHNAIHADATKELGNNWFTRNPDATAAMIAATIFSGGAASGAAGGAGAGAGSAAAGGAAAGGATASGATAAGAGAGMTAAELAAAEGAGSGLTMAGSGATGSGLVAGNAAGTTLGAGSGASGTGLYAAQSPTASAEAAYTGKGLLAQAGDYANKGAKTYIQAKQVQGLLAPQQAPQAQAEPVQNKPADFSGLLTQYVPDDKWSQQYAQYVQGLMGGGGYGRFTG